MRLAESSANSIFWFLFLFFFCLAKLQNGTTGEINRLDRWWEITLIETEKLVGA